MPDRMLPAQFVAIECVCPNECGDNEHPQRATGFDSLASAICQVMSSKADVMHPFPYYIRQCLAAVTYLLSS